MNKRKKRHFKGLLTVFVCTVMFSSWSQQQSYERIIELPSDTLFVQFSLSDKWYEELIPDRDTIDFGTDGGLNVKITLKAGTELIEIPYKSLPYRQVHYFSVQTPTKKGVVRVHFNPITAAFSQQYIEQATGKTHVEVPEVFELTNIVWLLSAAGKQTHDLPRSGSYYEDVKRHFAPYAGHAIFRQFDFHDSLLYDVYYDFRENSFAYQFSEDKLVCEGPYYYVTGFDWEHYDSYFRRLIPLLEDFAKVSGFRRFYADHQDYYRKLEDRQSNMMPLKDMWVWLEKEFPAQSYQSLKVVFSPLIGGSHSTQRFSTFTRSDNGEAGVFREIVMFVCGPELFDDELDLTEEQKSGLMSGIVFTEIDHNYVNPVSDQYDREINEALKRLNRWTSSAASAYYRGQYAVFNEYMTHALFCLWAEAYYPKQTAALVIKKCEELMVKKRGFLKFKAFYQTLKELHSDHPEKPIADLYPDLIKWCGRQS